MFQAVTAAACSGVAAVVENTDLTSVEVPGELETQLAAQVSAATMSVPLAVEPTEMPPVTALAVALNAVIDTM